MQYFLDRDFCSVTNLLLARTEDERVNFRFYSVSSHLVGILVGVVVAESHTDLLITGLANNYFTHILSKVVGNTSKSCRDISLSSHVGGTRPYGRTHWLRSHPSSLHIWRLESSYKRHGFRWYFESVLRCLTSTWRSSLVRCIAILAQWGRWGCSE